MRALSASERRSYRSDESARTSWGRACRARSPSSCVRVACTSPKPCRRPFASVVADGVEDTEALFRDYRWTVRPKRGQNTFASRDVLARLRAEVCASAAPLLARGGALPEETFALGPVWLERWSDVASEESFRFDALVERHAERKRRLLDACRQMSYRSGFPGPLAPRRAGRSDDT